MRKMSTFTHYLKKQRCMKTKIVTFGEILLRLSKPEYQRLFQGHRMLGNYGGS